VPGRNRVLVADFFFRVFIPRSAFLPGHVTVPHNARTKERKQKRGPMRI
jgi:hypothetical protein